ncbi:MAG: CsbD family protein [Acidobacteriaceae bacterium]
MDKNQISGKFDQASGKGREETGKVVGSQKMEDKGKADQVKGSSKEAWGKAKESEREIVTDKPQIEKKAS